MKIYHDNRTRSLRCVWAAEELGLPYEVVPGVIGSPELLAVNPSGTVPAFVDGDVVLTESMAICEYLAAKAGPTDLVPQADDPLYPAYIQYLWLGEASVGMLMMPYILNKFFAPDEQKGGWIAEFNQQALPRRIALIAEQLKRHPFIAGGRFTLADISVYYSLNLLELVDLPGSATPEIVDYRERMRARPAFIRAMEA